MITHGTHLLPANGGCSEFIKDFGIGFLIKGCGLANKGERPATILATQRPNTGRDYRVSGGKGQILRPNKINRLRLKAYYSVRCQANCKTVVVLSEIQSFRPGQGMSRSADPNGNFPARHAGSRGFKPPAFSPLNRPRSNSTDFPRLDLRSSRLVPRDSGILKPQNPNKSSV
jgi:hypothetical protein